MVTPRARRAVSTALLVAGVLCVLLGFAAALGFTPGGMLASAAAVAALLYVGAVWFSAPPADLRAAARARPSPAVVFDRDHRIVAGGKPGDPVAAAFPHIVRPEIERRCAAALARGAAERFGCIVDGRPLVVDIAPVRTADGSVACGILLVSDTEAGALAASA
jgi:hypothetical protein